MARNKTADAENAGEDIANAKIAAEGEEKAKPGKGAKRSGKTKSGKADKKEAEAPKKSHEEVPPVISDGEEGEEKREIVFEEALEAVLFAAGHPISYATLARVMEMTPGLVKDKVFEYALKYNDPGIPRGVMLLTFADSCQLCTKEYYLHEIREVLGLKKNGTLSTSSMEVLAIVAYNQPVTRVFVDTLRRADSSYAMNNLIDRGLIECKGRLDVPGRPMLFGTTNDFLRAFGLKSLDELPSTTEEMNSAFSKAKNDAEAEGGEGDEELNEITGGDGQLAIDFEKSKEAGEVPADGEVADGEVASRAPADESPEENADDAGMFQNEHDDAELSEDENDDADGEDTDDGADSNSDTTDGQNT